jgi:hydroxypyruvate isomerase
LPRFAANLSLMFNEVPFLERFEAAAAAGFAGVEFLFPYDHDPQEIAARLAVCGLTNVLFNLPPRARHRRTQLSLPVPAAG